MRVVKCSSCGFAAARELPRCPNCRQKTLVFHHTFDTSGHVLYNLVRTREYAQGSHPAVSLLTLTFFALGMSYVLHSWMFPDKLLSNDLPRLMGLLTETR